MPRKTLIQNRRDTAANWTSVNPVLASGEIGFETDTNTFKIGDGVTAWSSLAYQNSTGTQGPPGPQGEPGASAGQIYYMDTAGGTYTGTTISGSITKTPVTGTKTTITGRVSKGTFLVGSFLTGVGVLTDLTIDPGFWLLHTYGFAESGVYHFYKLYIVDADGTSNKTLVSEGSTSNSTVLSESQSLNSYVNYVPAGTIPDSTKRGIIDLYIYTTGNNKDFTLEFRGDTFSHLHTTMEVEPASLGDIGDVNLTSVQDNDILVYDSTTSVWQNQQLSATQGIAFSSSHSGTTWNVTHNLGYRPSVTTTDNALTPNVVEGTVVHIDANSLTVTFTTNVGGTVYLS